MFGNKNNAVAFTKAAFAISLCVTQFREWTSVTLQKIITSVTNCEIYDTVLSLWAITFHNKVTGDVYITRDGNPLQCTRASTYLEVNN